MCANPELRIEDKRRTKNMNYFVKRKKNTYITHTSKKIVQTVIIVIVLHVFPMPFLFENMNNHRDGGMYIAVL